MTAFWEAAQLLGKNAHLYYLSRAAAVSILRRSLDLNPRSERHEPFFGTAFPSILPELDAFNQIAGGMRIARRIRSAEALWVVAATAPYGFAALNSGRPYACWLATGLESEWASRRPGLPPSRKLALTINAPVLRRLEREVIRRATLVYAISPASRETIAEAAGLPREQVGVLPIPVDLERFTPEPDAAWRSRLAEPTIAFVGRGNDPRKNLRLLLDAFPSIRARVPQARLRIIGEPPDRAAGASLGPGIDVLGNVDSVAAHLKTAALLVLPSLQEGFGIVVAEALASGVPVAVTPCGGPEDLVRASAGGIVLPDFQPNGLAAEVAELLERPERLSEMRERGRRYVAHEHSLARLCELLAGAFEELEARG